MVTLFVTRELNRRHPVYQGPPNRVQARPPSMAPKIDQPQGRYFPGEPTMREFKYLFSARAGQPDRLPETVLECNVPLDAVSGTALAGAGAGLVVRDERSGAFLFFEQARDFLTWQDQAAERSFHEVLFGTLPQRIKFDIDATPEAVDAIDASVLDRVRAGWGATDCEAVLADILEEDYVAAPPPAGHEARLAKALAAVGYLVDVIVDEFEARYGGDGHATSPRHVLVMSSMLADAAPDGLKQKYSFHILVMPYMVANNLEARDFTRAVLDIVHREAPELEGLVDPSVNGSTQNFRVLGSQKPGSGRPKVADPRIADALGTMKLGPQESTLVSKAPGSRLLPLRVAQPEAEPALISADAVHRHLDEITELVFRGDARPAHTLHRVVDGPRGVLVLFSRTRPSKCHICDRVHHSDNSLMVLAAPRQDAEPQQANDGGLLEIFELCRRAPGKSRPLGYVACAPGTVVQAPPRAAQPDGRLAQIVADIESGSRDPRATADSLFDDLPAERTTVYSDSAMRPYEAGARTLVVKAQMGVGKTRRLRKYIDAHYPRPGAGSLRSEPVIRFVTFRQTFSNSLKLAFPDFKSYSDLRKVQIGNEQAPRLIVQVESLHRLMDAAMAGDGVPCDLLVLDEVESVLAQFSSGLHRSFSDSFAVFQWLLARSATVVCMDANVSDRTFRTLQRMRPHAPAHFHHNTYTRAAGDTYEVTQNRGDWTSALLAALQRGKRVALASNSLKEAKVVARMASERFPHKRVKVYSSETAQSEKTEHFADVDTHWAGLDLLVYTPTVSAGVSFEVAPGDGGYDCMFVYLSSSSCDVETARQMLGRVRALADRRFCVCLGRGYGPRLPTDPAAIERLVYQRRELVAGTVLFPASPPPQVAEFDPQSGTVRPYRSPFFPMWVETTRIANLSRNDYAARFVDQVAATGAAVCVLSAPDDEGGAARRSKAAAAIDYETERAVVHAPDLAPDEVAAVRDRMRGSAPGDVTDDDRAAVTRYSMRAAYCWDGDINHDFVRTYCTPNTQRVFCNLRTVLSYDSHDQALEAIRSEERTFYSAVVARLEQHAGDLALQSRLEHTDISRRYRFPQHMYAVWMLRLCGFLSLLDTAALPESRVVCRVLAAYESVRREMDFVLQEFSVRHPGHRRLSSSDPLTRFKAVLCVINAVLRRTYGVEVAATQTPALFGPRMRPVWVLRSTAVSRAFGWPACGCGCSPGAPSARPSLPGAGACAHADAARSFLLRWVDEAPEVACDFAHEVDPGDARPMCELVREVLESGRSAPRCDFPTQPSDVREFVAYVRGKIT